MPARPPSSGTTHRLHLTYSRTRNRVDQQEHRSCPPIRAGRRWAGRSASTWSSWRAACFTAPRASAAESWPSDWLSSSRAPRTPITAVSSCRALRAAGGLRARGRQSASWCCRTTTRGRETPHAPRRSSREAIRRVGSRSSSEPSGLRQCQVEGGALVAPARRRWCARARRGCRGRRERRAPTAATRRSRRSGRSRWSSVVSEAAADSSTLTSTDGWRQRTPRSSARELGSSVASVVSAGRIGVLGAGRQSDGESRVAEGRDADGPVALSVRLGVAVLLGSASPPVLGAG